jgi:hypothetical protein
MDFVVVVTLCCIVDPRDNGCLQATLFEARISARHHILVKILLDAMMSEKIFGAGIVDVVAMKES